MNACVIDSQKPVVFLGGGEVTPETLNRALSLGSQVVAADGGARAALRAGLMPDAVIGDFDSIDPETKAAIPADRLHHVAEQESTDFEKCLMRVRAPLVLAVGFAGGRIDHGLAAMNALVRRPEPPCIILSDQDVLFAAPPEIALALPRGTRVSLFPMAQVTGHSQGLRWPIDGIDFAADGRVGTSNEVSEGPVRLSFDARGMLVVLPIAHLPQAVRALMPD